METTSPVMSITDEQIAEIEALAKDACQYAGQDWFTAPDLSAWFADDDALFMAAASPFALRSLISRLRAAEMDSARYQWLCEFKEWSDDVDAALDCGSKPVIDAAIDAAMKREQQ